LWATFFVDPAELFFPDLVPTLMFDPSAIRLVHCMLFIDRMGVAIILLCFFFFWGGGGVEYVFV
jgi:hypothetical protein